MAREKIFDSTGEKPAKPSRAERQRPNRIYELTQSRGWTYADVADQVRALAKTKRDKKRERVHELTINKLALGKQKLTQDWMETLGEVFGMPAINIIATPQSGNLRLLKVGIALEGGVWKESAMISPSEQFEVTAPHDLSTDGAQLYAAEIRGPSSSLRYPDRSILILSKITLTPGEIAEGRRYHVRVTRFDGLREETIKRLVIDKETSKFWLRPESDHPDFQVWIPLEGRPGEIVEVIGRVRGVYTRED